MYVVFTGTRPLINGWTPIECTELSANTSYERSPCEVLSITDASTRPSECPR